MRYAVSVVTLALVACGQNNSGSDSGVTCRNSPIAPGSTTTVSPYQPGMTASSTTGTTQVVLDVSNPAPPSLDLNTWTITVTDGNGSPLAGDTVTAKNPCMPWHNHCATVTPTAQRSSGAKWTVTNLDFFMLGIFRVPFDVSNGTTADTVNFYVCIDG